MKPKLLLLHVFAVSGHQLGVYRKDSSALSPAVKPAGLLADLAAIAQPIFSIL